MKIRLTAALLFISSACGAQTVYGRLLQELDSFETDTKRYVVNGWMKRPDGTDSVRITALSKRLYSDRTIIVAHAKGGRQYIIDDGQPEFRVSPRSYTAVLRANDSTAAATDLYDRCLLWIAKSYSRGQATIDLQDRASGMIVVSPTLSGGWSLKADGTDEATVTYTLSIQARKGRIKVDQESYTLHAPGFPYGIPLNAEAKAPDFFGGSQQAQRTFTLADRAADNDRDFLIEGLTTAINESSDW